MKQESTVPRRMIDPDPISVAGFVVATVTAAISFFQLLIQIRERGERRQRSEEEDFRKAISKADRLIQALVEDIMEFDRLCTPSIVTTPNGTFFIWDLDSYQFRSLDRLLHRLAAGYMQLQKVQDKLGQMELRWLGDAWRFHPIARGTTLFKMLASIESLEQLTNLKEQLVQTVIEYHQFIEETKRNMAER